MTPRERAKKSAQTLLQKDLASPWFGMQVKDLNEGYAVISLAVQDRHANGHGTCHGGVTFALADTAFAFACNSRNQPTVAQHNSISYIAPARPGDTLTATAKEVSLVGKNGLYDVTVTNQDSAIIAEFRGCSRAVRGTLFDE